MVNSCSRGPFYFPISFFSSPCITWIQHHIRRIENVIKNNKWVFANFRQWTMISTLYWRDHQPVWCHEIYIYVFNIRYLILHDLFACPRILDGWFTSHQSGFIDVSVSFFRNLLWYYLMIVIHWSILVWNTNF